MPYYIDFGRESAHSLNQQECKIVEDKGDHYEVTVELPQYRDSYGNPLPIAVMKGHVRYEAR